ncbi:UBP1-associated proteins 1C-like [Pistacia vera]|uniref:UBP1-associated proteins 1C-like n=1 Tax=Pistacia vera TaxID=55513 RepID=UPI0012635431|nr:UBP1-associated proteins 1C-like [Pistacia vera]XP_031255678.1 UBP1-associated proteins 1C-like [Pistacia vera]
MVWFQCEDCGENLKKPKLPNHFRICSASKLSCIDCGEIFGQQSVQSHTQCITEAEKYGPKGQNKVSNGTTPKSNKDSKQKPELDINVGLSEQPPWFCSLCNTKATSRQTLLLHADGKKHRAKARAHHAANQPKQSEEAPDMKLSMENTAKGEVSNNKHVEEPKVQDFHKDETMHINTETVDVNLPSSKKRKHHASENDGTRKKAGSEASAEAGNGEVIQAEEAERSLKKVKNNVLKEDKLAECISTNISENCKTQIKWKKLIKSALKTHSDGVVKLKKLKKLVLKSLQESGVQGDKTQLNNMLEQKINSSSRFTVDGKYVRLVAKD